MAQGTDLALRCRCGTVRGVALGIRPAAINHCFCYCEDCQAFVHYVGRTDDVFDAHGGTEIAQMSQACVAFTAGSDALAAVRLTPKGLMRWYSGCCSTPIGNTLASSALPFVGLLRAFMDSPPPEALGPIRGRGWAKRAKGGAAAVPKDGFPDAVMVARMLVKVVGWRLRGDHERSPFFAASGKPLATPRVLTPAEREDLRLRCSRWRGEGPSAGAT